MRMFDCVVSSVIIRRYVEIGGVDLCVCVMRCRSFGCACVFDFLALKIGVELFGFP